ncbi:hypothetical protein CspeluHIS016_0105320 [Cutaneotrichosporon spelunceum]|uniref:NAD(P)-binding domain-containing protein n=1 Tax=Cutaneotrichosporon spelunceum TaxID=1672016 RepID=A0AAD3Y879_9TREE|nr:hypothetical protein CspeluHIS016_0105320 [Cutaneotrichosporon spelunceum]
MTFHIAILGGSRGIANHVLHNLTASATATLLLRKPDCLDKDSAVVDGVQAGRIKIVKGDATVEADVEKAVEGAQVVLTSVGGTPHFTLGGFQLDNPTLCTDAALALLRVLERKPESERPRVIAISSMGLGDNHYKMPFLLRLLYPWMLSGPHADKEGMEYLYLRASNITGPTPAPPPTKILSEANRDVPERMLPELILIRPALLVDGTEGGVVRAGEDVCTYRVSRFDVARWISDNCMPGEEAWVNRAPVLGY